VREDHAARRIDGDELRAAEDAAIRDVVKLQRDVGLRTVTDDRPVAHDLRRRFAFLRSCASEGRCRS
jgi:methionine synthase II (cobalamin-independent)